MIRVVRCILTKPNLLSFQADDDDFHANNTTMFSKYGDQGLKTQ